MDEHAVSGELDPGVVVHGEVAERMRGRWPGLRERSRGGDDDGRSDRREALTRAPSSDGAQRTENAGLCATACDTTRTSRAGRPAQPMAYPRWKKRRASRVPRRSARSEPLGLGAPPCTESAHPSVSPVDRGRSARARRAGRTVSAGRMPWVCGKTAVSGIDPETVRREDLSMTGDRRALTGSRGRPTPPLEQVGEQGHELRRGTAVAARRAAVRSRDGPSERGVDTRRSLLEERGRIPGRSRAARTCSAAVSTLPSPNASLASSTCVHAVGSGAPPAASSASCMAATAPARSPVSSLAYATRAYDARLGRTAAMRSNVAKACR